ncbi:AEC family transporter [Mycoplasma procyoni]|uniref:AEC family transporter n=1 Tax=Mycoplasma procyoni TaxID=568784 RepID=UPI00197C2C24|nr:AEC family transporter [Mycoplasma procyoni]MBN3534905.1 AEC family transporter [Mycoplasma procyoni]
MEKLIKVLQNQSMWGAIIASIGIIALGYLLTKFKVLKQESKGFLNKIVLIVSLPALAFSGFMKSATFNDVKEQMFILGSGFFFYIFLSVSALVWIKVTGKVYNKSKTIQAIAGENVSNSRALVIWMLLIFGSTTFFGLPIITAVYSKAAVLAANIWNIPYRIFIYSLCFMLMSGLKFNKANFKQSMKTALLNPIVIATFLGLVLWLTQLIPGTKVTISQKEYGWFELSVTLPLLHKIFSTLSSLASPLIWITIGMTLATVPLLSALKNLWVWLFVALKLVAIPTFVLLIMLILTKTNNVSADVASAMVIFAAVPPSTVAVAYAIQFKKHDVYAAQCSALSTLCAIIMMPIWIVVLNFVF